MLEEERQDGLNKKMLSVLGRVDVGGCLCGHLLVERCLKVAGRLCGVMSRLQGSNLIYRNVILSYVSLKILRFIYRNYAHNGLSQI
jgi:hypothetical protein